MIKQKIEARDNATGKNIAIVYRVLKAEIMGNFNPIFCRYKNHDYLVKSEKGDISDPFRRDASYLKLLYIEV